MEDPAKREANKKRVQIIALLIFVFFSAIGIWLWTNSEKFIDYEHTLAMSAKTVNLVCPTMIDEETRLDSVATRPGRNYLYYFTVLNIDRSTLELEDEEICDLLRETVLENLKGDFSIAEFGKNNVTLIYNYNDKNAVELCSVRLLPEDYYQPKKASADSLSRMAP